MKKVFSLLLLGISFGLCGMGRIANKAFSGINASKVALSDLGFPQNAASATEPYLQQAYDALDKILMPEVSLTPEQDAALGNIVNSMNLLTTNPALSAGLKSNIRSLPQRYSHRFLPPLPTE